MAALGGVEKIGDRAENNHDAGAQKRKAENQGNAENGQNQRVFDQGLPFPAGAEGSNRRWESFNDGSHLRKLTEISLKVHQRNGFDNERDIERRDKPMRVSARDLREWNFSNL
jgi:hypothetical protein